MNPPDNILGTFHRTTGKVRLPLPFSVIIRYRVTLDVVKSWMEAVLVAAGVAGLVGGLPVYKNYKKRRDEEREKDKKRDEAIDKMLAAAASFLSVEKKVRAIESAVASVAVTASRLAATHKQTLDEVNQALWECNAEGYCISVNPAWERLFGVSQEQAMGLGWRQAIHKEDLERTWNSWSSSVKLWAGGEMRGIDWQEYYRIVNKGEVLNCWARASPYFDHNGKIAGFVGVTMRIADTDSDSIKHMQ